MTRREIFCWISLCTEVPHWENPPPQNFLLDLGVVPLVQSAITLYCDNSGAVTNSKEPRSHKRGKHIERTYDLIREIISRGDAMVSQIASEDNLADPFTMGLVKKIFD